MVSSAAAATVTDMKTLVAMSGGVDSSYAAALALERGGDVVGVTMLLWGGKKEGRSCSTSDQTAAAAAAAQLGIDHVVVDLTDEFERAVVEPFVAGAATGVTRNPCVSCNANFKVEWLFNYAAAHGFDQVCTGHHARVVDVDGESTLARSVDTAKDQSYVIHMLDRDHLARLWLPLGELTKDQVRDGAAELGLVAADAVESMDLCFSRSDAIAERTGLHDGDVVTQDGAVVGHVTAVELVTIGQRRGLGTGGGDPLYVTAVDPPTRRVTVGKRADIDVDVTYVDAVGGNAAGLVYAQTSAHGTAEPAVFDPEHGTVVWENPHRKVAPGQAVVMYNRVGGTDVVVGWGTAT